jgi:hypothetical protein
MTGKYFWEPLQWCICWEESEGSAVTWFYNLLDDSTLIVSESGIGTPGKVLRELVWDVMFPGIIILYPTDSI